MIQPIFVTGFERSGTTLVRRLISMHPALKYNLLHENRRLLQYKTKEEAELHYFKVSMQAGEEIGGLDHIKAGEKIPFNGNVQFIIEYIKRWREWWPESLIVYVTRDPIACAKSVERKRGIPILDALAMHEQNVNVILPVLDKLENVYTVDYELLIDDPEWEVEYLYKTIIGETESTNLPDYIQKVITTKDPWQHEGRTMCGLRYHDKIERLH